MCVCFFVRVLDFGCVLGCFGVFWAEGALACEVNIHIPYTFTVRVLVFGVFLGVFFGCVLGRAGVGLCVLGVFLGCFWGVFGVFWCVLGRGGVGP